MQTVTTLQKYVFALKYSHGAGKILHAAAPHIFLSPWQGWAVMALRSHLTKACTTPAILFFQKKKRRRTKPQRVFHIQPSVRRLKVRTWHFFIS